MMTAIEILVITLKNGGLSVNPYQGGKHPKKGFMVSMQGSEKQVSLNEDIFHLEREIGIFVKDKKDSLEGVDDLYIGTWIEKGVFFLDLSTNVMERDEAEKIGRYNAQIAIYDVENRETIYLNEK